MMDNRARRGDKTKKKRGHKRPRHNYSEDTRELILDQVGVGPERKKQKKSSVYTFCQTGHTPHPSTIYRWRQQLLQPHTSDEPHPPRGRPSHLSSVEKLVLGGWVIEQDEQHLPVSSNTIQSWVAENYQEKVSAAWVTRTMSSLHITSHHSSTRPDKYKRPHLMQDLFRFLLSLRNKVDEGYQEAQVVAIDTVRFTHPSPILRTYSPQGGYVLAINFINFATNLFSCLYNLISLALFINHFKHILEGNLHSGVMNGIIIPSYMKAW